MNNKIDELQANVNFLSEYRHASLLAITETWFEGDDKNISLDNFTLYRGDRTAESGKQCGGGVCLFVNQRYCHPNHVHVTQDTCTPDVEILSATLRPYYLPREFPKLNVNIVYVPPDGNDGIAAQAISDVVNQQLTASPDSVVIVTGDFNTCVIDSHIPHFTQYVDCPTRKDKTLDKCYVNVKNAYKARQMPALGKSDHLMVELLPSYQTLMKRMPVVKKEIKVWDDSDACESLRGCLECTDWNVFFDDCNDLDEANDVVTDYIKFCESLCIETKTIKYFPNNKPWVTKEIKGVINEKKRAYAEGNEEKIKSVQKKLSNMIKEGKDKYKQKLERSFKEGNAREAWAGMNKIAGVTKSNAPLDVNDGKSYADELNEFYSRFDNDATPDLNSKFKHDFLSDFSMTKIDLYSPKRKLNLFLRS